jgi:nucleoside-diphosphate-sugar epimerase
MTGDFQEALDQKQVFVTGATGFIGRRLVGALRGAGARVTVLARSRHGTKEFRGTGVKAVIGDLDDRALLADALPGHDMVFHLAYDVRASAATNLKAFDAVYSAAENCGIARFVHTSSIVVYDGWPNLDIDENSPMDRPGGSPYRQAKIQMERRLMGGAVPAAIIQPTIVYGPASSQWTDGFAEKLAAGSIVLPTPEGRCNGVFVDDVVQALLRAAVLEGLGQERFIISGPSPFQWSELFDGYAKIIGTGSVQHRPLAELQAGLGPKPDESAGSDQPSAMASISALGRRVLGRERFEALVRLAKQRLRKGGAAYPDHHLLEEFSSTGICSIKQAKKRLGYAPAFDLASGLVASEQHLNALFPKP